MTEEGLKNYKAKKKLLDDNGFVVASAEVYDRNASTSDLNEIIGTLNGLKKSINEGVDVSTFAKDISYQLDEIEKVINADNYFRNNIGAKDFENLLNNLRGKFELAQNYLKAEKVLENRAANLRDVQQRIHDLDADKTMDRQLKSDQTLELVEAKKEAKIEKERALKFRDEQKEIFDKSLTNFDLNKYRNDLLQNIKALDTSYRKLSLESSAMDKLATIIGDTRDKIVVFGRNIENSQREFAELCKKYGLEATDMRKVELQEEVVNEISAPEIIENVPKNEVIEENSKKIENVEDLLSVMKVLNPDLKVNEEVEKDGSTYKYIEVEDASKLVLPEGFNYNKNLGINNKTDDLKPYIRLEVKEIIRENELINDFEEPKLDEIPSQKEPEEKHKVTKKRKAIIEKFAKNVLKYSAIGAENIKYGFIDVAKEISHIGSKLKNKLIGKNTVDVPELDETMDKNAVKGNKTKLLSFLRLRKNKKTVEEKTPVEPEVVNKPKEEKKPDEYEELDDDIKKSISDALADIGNSNNNNQAKLEEVTDYNEYATIDDLLNSQGGR